MNKIKGVHIKTMTTLSYNYHMTQVDKKPRERGRFADPFRATVHLSLQNSLLTSSAVCTAFQHSVCGDRITLCGLYRFADASRLNAVPPAAVRLMTARLMTTRRRRYWTPATQLSRPAGDSVPVTPCPPPPPPFPPQGALLEAESTVDGTAVTLLATDPLADQALLAFDAELMDKRPLGNLEKLQLPADR